MHRLEHADPNARTRRPSGPALEQTLGLTWRRGTTLESFGTSLIYAISQDPLYTGDQLGSPPVVPPAPT